MKKFLYKDAQNRQSEIFGYSADDFVSSAGPLSANKPVLTNSLGLLDSSFIPSVPAASLQINRVAAESIVPGDCVYAIDEVEVGLAAFNDSIGKATVFGIAMTNANVGDTVTVLVFGILSLPIYSVFPVNVPLFLDIDGAITDERPLTDYLTIVGKSLGGGSIFVNVSQPKKLT